MEVAPPSPSAEAGGAAAPPGTASRQGSDGTEPRAAAGGRPGARSDDGLALPSPLAAPGADGIPARRRRRSRLFVVGAVLFAGLCVAVGLFGYSTHRGQVFARARGYLVAATDTRTNELVSWREERYADARFLHANPAFRELVRRTMADPADEALAVEVRAWLDPMFEGHGYRRISLTDAAGRVRTSLGAQPTQTDPRRLASFRRALASDRVEVGDLFPDPSDGLTHLDLVIPYRFGAAGRDAANSPPDALLALDAIVEGGAWAACFPAPLPSAESLLVRHAHAASESDAGDGGAVLSESLEDGLRATVATFGAPIHAASAAAAPGSAARVLDGRDGRNVPVLAAVRPIPESSWSVVTKMDRDEVEGPIRELSLVVTTVLLVLLGFAATVVVTHSRKERARDEAAVERALRTGAELYQGLVEATQDLVWTTDAQGVLTSMSRAAERYGRRPEDVVGHTLTDLLHPGDRARASAALAASLGQGVPSSGLEVRVLLARRDERIFSISAVPIRDEAGTIVGLMGTAQDVTVRRRAEADLRRRLASQRLVTSVSSKLLAAAPDTADVAVTWALSEVAAFAGVARCRLVHRAADGSDAWTVLGSEGALPPDAHEPPETHPWLLSALSSGAGAVIHASELPEPIADVRERLRADGAASLAAGAVQDREGVTAVLSVMSPSLRPDWSEELTVVLATVGGILASALDRQSATRRMSLQAAALEAAANGIVVTSPDGRILWVNDAACTLSGHPREALVGATPRIFRSGRHDRAFFEHMWSTISSGRVWRGEIENLRADGTVCPEEMTITPVRDGTGAIRHYVAVKQDVTDRRAAEEALHRSNEELQQALLDLKAAEATVIRQERLRALGSLASGVAHDFNNALTAILGYSEMLLRRPEDLSDPETVRRNLAVIRDAAHDAGAVVARLREFYRPPDDSADLDSVDLAEVVRGAVTLSQPRWKNEAEARGLRVSVRVEGEGPALVAGRPAELREAVLNLILNAVDALPEGGEIVLRTSGDGARVALDVEDTGVGMTDEARARCFEPFFSTKGDRGTGLGLAMVHGIVRRHGGTIDLESERGAGTRFRLVFPAAATAGPRASQDAAPEGQRLRILVVDDDSRTRTVVAAYLDSLGHEPVAAASADDALRTFMTSRIDLAVIDRAMPGMNGDLLASLLRAGRPDLPIIMLTGFGSMMRAALDAPTDVDVVLGKPAKIGDLRAAIAEATSRHPASAPVA